MGYETQYDEKDQDGEAGTYMGRRKMVVRTSSRRRLIQSQPRVSDSGHGCLNGRLLEMMSLGRVYWGPVSVSVTKVEVPSSVGFQCGVVVAGLGYAWFVWRPGQDLTVACE